MLLSADISIQYWNTEAESWRWTAFFVYWLHSQRNLICIFVNTSCLVVVLIHWLWSFESEVLLYLIILGLRCKYCNHWVSMTMQLTFSEEISNGCKITDFHKVGVEEDFCPSKNTLYQIKITYLVLVSVIIFWSKWWFLWSVLVEPWRALVRLSCVKMKRIPTLRKHKPTKQYPSQN